MLVLPRSARTAAWATAWLSGAGSLDDVLDAVRGDDEPPEVLGLPGEPGPVGFAVALGAVRARGATGLRLALPVAGDPLGLPGPALLTHAAVAAGEAVLAVGLAWALVPEVRRYGPEADEATVVRWHVHEASDRAVDVPSLAEAETGLADAVRGAAADLAALDVAGAAPQTLQALGTLRSARAPLLPTTHGPRADHLAGQALRLLAVVRLARAEDGAAVSSSQVLHRAAALDPVDRAARRALVAAVGSALEPTPPPR